MLLSGSIVVGFVRLCLMLILLFYLNRKFISYNESVNYFDFIAKQWFKYGSIILLLIFSLVELGIYNLLNTMIIIALIMAVDYFGIKKIPSLFSFISQKIKKYILELIKNLEQKKTISSLIITRSDSEERNKRIWFLFLLLTLGIVAFYSRYVFYPFDMYSMSASWLSDLENVINFDSQKWFTNSVTPVGELALVNFYSKFVNISPETALQSMGILETVLISVLLFWVINKISFSKIIAPLVSALFFSVSYTIMPVNINYILQHQPLILGLCFALPTMVYYIIPNQEVTNKFYRFINFLFVFLAIGLVDIFTLIILIFPFLIIGLLISSIKDKLSNLIVLGAYCFSLLLLFIIYGIAGVYFGDELKLIIHSSLMSVSTYTYFSHLIISYDNLMHYYQYLSYGCMLFCITFQIINKEKWNAALCFLLHFNFLIVLTKFKNDWIDTDLVKLSLAVFIPIVLGIAIAIVVRLVYFISSKAERIKPVIAVVMIGMVLSAAMHYQVKEYHKLNQSDSVPKEVISIYEKITNNYFPFSYAVVNDNSTQIISTNKHFFINYDEFSETYLKRDAVYFKHKENKIFLKNNPQCILPKSVLVFIYKPNKNNPNEIEKNSKYNTVIMEKLQNLSKRGRKISVFYNSKSIRVYEIENIPGESKVDHLIF